MKDVSLKERVKATAVFDCKKNKMNYIPVM
jgi:hypothetical protein